MALHRKNYRTSYEVAAINNQTNERIFVAVSNGSKSRNTLHQVLFRELNDKTTRLERIALETGQPADSWTWEPRAAEGIRSGNWQVKFTGRTALDVDQHPLPRSIYKKQTTIAAKPTETPVAPVLTKSPPPQNRLLDFQ